MTGVLKVKVGDKYVPIGGGTGGTREAGEISIWPTTTPPVGWALCDGALLNRADYPELFARIQTQFNTGGETAAQFRLPNLKGRVPVGRDAAQTEFDALGETGGAKTHTLTGEQIPTHSHPLTQTFVAPGGEGVASIVYSVTSANTGPYGGGQPHNNLQPYIALNYIIRLTTDRGGVKRLAAPVMKRLVTEAVISSGTPTAVSGLSHTFTVESATDIFAVDVVLDVRGSASAAAQTLCVGDLYVDGAAVPGAVVSGGDGIIRTTAAQQWHLTGLAPGSHTVEVRASRAGGTAINLHLAAAHSSIAIRQLPTTVGDAASTELDTGLRDITSLAHSDFVTKTGGTGKITVRRIGKRVDLHVISQGGSNPGSVTVYGATGGWPAGFGQPDVKYTTGGNTYRHATAPAVFSMSDGTNYGGGQFIHNLTTGRIDLALYGIPSGHPYHAEFSFITDEPWPTVLPGVAAV